jgi:sterol O-acyltransferase
VVNALPPTAGIMASTSINHLEGHSDRILRPRPRKPVHSQLSQISNISEPNSALETPSNGHATGTTR